MVTWSWRGFDDPLLNHVLTTLSVPKHISLLSAHTCTLILRCTNTVKGVWASVRDTLGISVSLSFLLWAHKVQTHTNTYTYLGRLGCGEVKPGRDKVMLRHLGPVFPVSGSRHQTSWPGSTKRFFFNSVCNWKHRNTTLWCRIKSHFSLIACHPFHVFSSQGVLFSAENMDVNILCRII